MRPSSERSCRALIPSSSSRRTSRTRSPTRPDGGVSLRRLHPALLVHTTRIAGRRRLVAQGSAARPPLILNQPAALTALAALPEAFDRESAGAAWGAAGISGDAQRELWNAFDAAGLLPDAAGDDASWWDELGWREA